MQKLLLALSSIAVISLLCLSKLPTENFLGHIPIEHDTLLLVGGYNGYMRVVDRDGGVQLMEQEQYKDISWIQKIDDDNYILTGEYPSLMVYGNMKEQKQVKLQQLTQPVATELSANKENIIVACYGKRGQFGSGIAKIHMETQELHEISDWDQFKPTEPSPDATKIRQDVAHVHHVITDMNQPDYILATDLGYDHIYRYHPILNTIKVVHDFPRGTGPRHMAFDSDGYLYVVTEMSVELLKLDKDFNLVKKTQLAKTIDYDGGEVHVNDQNEIFVSVRRIADDKAGLIYKYDQDLNQLAKNEEILNWPRQFSLSLDQKEVLVAGKTTSNVQILDADTLAIKANIQLKDINPAFVMDDKITQK